MVVDGKLSDARDKGVGIADCLGAVGRQLEFQRFDGTTLPADVQSNNLPFWPLRHGDVAYKQTQYPLAVSRRCGRCSPKFWQVAGKLEDLPLLLGGHGAQGLSFEGCQLSLEFLQALHGVVPALFEGRRDEVAGSTASYRRSARSMS